MVRELTKQPEGPGFESRHMGMDICGFCMLVWCHDGGTGLIWVPAQVSTSSLDQGSKLQGVL